MKKPGKVVKRTFPVPFHFRDAVDVEIKKMLADGVIEQSDSSYCSPLRIVARNDGRVRVCLDSRFIGPLIEDDHEFPPLINDIVQNFHGAKFFSITDLANSYWQILLTKINYKVFWESVHISYNLL